MKAIDLTGQRFGKLIAIKRIHVDKKPCWRWLCKCDCGKDVIVKTGPLHSGKTKSCSCLQKEKIGELRRTHGMTNTRLFNIWRHIKSRAGNIKDNNLSHSYKHVIVCDEWKNDF